MSPPIDPAETSIQVALRLALASVVGTGLLVLLVGWAVCIITLYVLIQVTMLVLGTISINLHALGVWWRTP